MGFFCGVRVTPGNQCPLAFGKAVQIVFGDMTEKQRNMLLGEMTEEVAELVLENNRSQIEAIYDQLAP